MRGLISPTIFVILLLPIGSFQINAQSQIDISADEKPYFTINFLVPEENIQRVEWAKYIASQLENIGIDVVIEITDFDSIWDRIDSNPYRNESGIPDYAHGGFDVTFVGVFSFYSHYLPGWLNMGCQFCSEGIEAGQNTQAYRNLKYDELRNNYVSELNQTKRFESFKEMQEILKEDLPVIPIFYPGNVAIFSENADIPLQDLIAIRNSRYEPVFFSTGWSDFELKNQDPLIISQNGWNALASLWDGGIGGGGTLYSSFVWQGLYERDRINNFNWKPLIAESMPEWNSEKTVATIKLKNNVTFADGTNLTAHDVVATYRLMLTDLGFYQYNIGFGAGGFFDLLATNDSIVAIDDYTVQFTLVQPSAFAFNIFSRGIVPTHTYGNNTHPSVDGGDFDQRLVNDTITYGTDLTNNPLSFGTGPYRFSNFSQDSPWFANVTLKASPNYWMGDVKTQEMRFIQYGHDYDGIRKMNDIKSGILHFGGAENDFNLTELNSFNGFSYQIIDNDNVQEMMINLNHPIIGTGAKTPNGIRYPSDAGSYSKYIRQAISHAIDRNYVVESIYGGLGKPAASPIPPATLGYDDTLKPHSYDLNLAINQLQSAGYPIETTTEVIDTTPVITSDTITTSKSEEDEFGIPFIIYFSVLIILPLIKTQLTSGIKRK